MNRKEDGEAHELGGKPKAVLGKDRYFLLIFDYFFRIDS